MIQRPGILLAVQTYFINEIQTRSRGAGAYLPGPRHRMVSELEES
jgi:hypothetical protein